MINVIIVDLISGCTTGINRYSDTLKLNKERSDIRIHHLVFQSFKGLTKTIITNDCFLVNYYCPRDITKIKQHKALYYDLITHLLSPLVSPMENVIWHMNHLGLSNIVPALRDKLGGKYILHLHCIPWKYSVKVIKRYTRLSELYQDKKFEDFKKMENSSVNYAKPDKIICLSDSAKYYLENVHKVDPSRIDKIYNGIDIDVEAFGLERETLTILYAGRITRDKGIFDFLDAINEVVQTTAYRPKIKLAGFSVISRSYIESKYEDLDVEFPGQIDFEELKLLYATSTFGVIPSLHEQCSYVAIEMAAFGLPLIVSDVDALSEMFEHRKTALFNTLHFDSEGNFCADKRIFVNNIIEMIENKDLRKTIGTNLKILYTERFLSKHMREQTFNTYESLIK
jgi:Glycosyltransferase